MFYPINYAQSESRALVEEYAKKYGLDPLILAALVAQESAGNPWAIRYEPGYRWVWQGPKPKGVSEATEAVQLKTSFGLCQVMGSLARELGCMDPFLTILCQPAKGLDYGARHLANLKKRWPKTADYLAAYNAGHPGTAPGAAYANAVLARAERLKEVWK